MLRPIALRKTSEVANKKLDLEIFGSGGIIQGDHALSYVRMGAKALQICSAVQDQDAATVYYDLESSLKAHIYLCSRKDLVEQGWAGQFPTKKFEEKARITFDSPEKIPKLIDLVGSHLKNIQNISDMKRTDFMVPQINEDKCLECGRCYLACADSGYQAISFTGFNSIP